MDSADSKSLIDHDNDSSSDAAEAPTKVIKRRKRISRACDECRRKKIRCDGALPCSHCQVYSYECTYDQPSNRRRNHTQDYVQGLEHRVHRAETLLHILIPNLDLNDPGIDAAVAQGWIPGAPGKGTPAAAIPATTQAKPPISVTTSPDSADMNLPSMIRAVAQIDIDENGNLDYHGHSSGLSFMHRMKDRLGDLLGPIPMSTPFIKSRPRSQVHDSPRSAVHSPSMSDGPMDDLPPKDIARQFCTNAIDIAAALLRIVHKPTFWASFERLYATPQDHWVTEDHQFLPLLFSTMAVGCLYGRDATSTSSTQHAYESAIEQGFTYFKAARGLMDIADCRDMPSVQAVTFMIFFMQSTAKLSGCYTYIGLALRAAVRLGLHRAYPAKDLIESETRKRVFWVIRCMDVYVSAMIGMPLSLSDDDIDQELPLEVDDEYITADAILPMPEGHVSLMSAFKAQTKLVGILQKIIRLIYPIKVQGQSDKSYAVPYSAVREIEADLEKWKAELHPALQPSETPGRLTRVQQLLRLAYAHSQVMLYRPFLHFANTEKKSKNIDQRAYACAASYVNVARNIVHITTQMRNKGLLNGAFWLIMYTCFFSIVSLIYYAAENPDNATTEAVLKDALEGKEVLASLASRSMAADRCSATLESIFSRLPTWMQEGKSSPTQTRKRHQSRPADNKTETASNRDGSKHSTKTQQHLQTSPPQQPSAAVAQQIVDSFAPWPNNTNDYVDPVSASNMDFETSGRSAINDLPQSFPSSALPDVSAIMFPSGNEPFNYPNQPLTTFESSHMAVNHAQRSISGLNTPQNASFPQSQTASPVPGLGGSIRGGHGDNLEAQLFALPPYMQQSQQTAASHMMGSNSLQNYSNGMNSQQIQQMAGLPANMTLGNNGANWKPTNLGQAQHAIHQQQSLAPDLGSMYLQELFGGTEWNPGMH